MMHSTILWFTHVPGRYHGGACQDAIFLWSTVLHLHLSGQCRHLDFRAQEETAFFPKMSQRGFFAQLKEKFKGVYYYLINMTLLKNYHDYLKRYGHHPTIWCLLCKLLEKRRMKCFTNAFSPILVQKSDRKTMCLYFVS